MSSNDSSGISTERWRQIERIYEEVVELDASSRDAYLARACAGDEDLHQEILSLLYFADQTDSFLEEPVLSLGLEVIGHRQEEMLGKHIGRYKLLELLGYGGMGDVYLTHDPHLNRRVALKLLPASITGDQERILRFKQEARAASAISHPNVAHIYEIGEANGRHYITMEYVAGKTLRQVLKQGRPDSHIALEITIQVLTALSAAHKSHVIHRDIKPENIMLREDGYVKVLDFGLAKLSESRSVESDDEEQNLLSLHTEPGLLMGTSHYMSPEQVRKQSVDGRTDLWSVGVMLYEMLTGQRPFKGPAVNEIIIAILEEEPEPLISKRPELPPALQLFVTKALRKRLDERYQTVDDMLADLRHIRQEMGDGYKNQGATIAAIPEPRALGSQDLSPATAEPRPPSTNELSHHVGTDPTRFATTQTSIFTSVSRFITQDAWRLVMGITLLATLVVSGLYFGLYQRRPRQWQSIYFDSQFENRLHQLQSVNFNPQFQRLNLSGSISDIVISPDGKYVASIITEDGKQSIHITELVTSSDLRIVPPSEKGYSGLSFSPDGNYIYYLEKQTETGTLNRVSKLGGGQRKILNNVNTPVTFSPDGKRIAFVRYNVAEETPDIIISQADGMAEQTLARRTSKDTDVFPVDMNKVGPSWSPDGKVLACATINWSSNPPEMNLEVIDVTNGTSRRLNAKPWYDISRFVWLTDGSGIIVAGTESPNKPWQLAMVSYPDGAIRRITNDPNNYTRISTTSDSQTFLTLNVEETSSIWRISPEGENQFAPLNVSQKKGVSEIAWKPDGKLVYTVSEGEDMNLWMQDADGQTARQLTFEHNKNFRPTISPDERHIVFVSTRAGIANIWRIDDDGTQLKQLTSGPYEDMPTITPDGKWVIYRTGINISKVSIDGGSPVELFDKGALYPVVSPDGQRLALFTNEHPESQEWFLEVYDLRSLKPVNRFSLNEASKPFNGLQWSPDGQGLIYVSNANGASNLWMQKLAGGTPKPLTDFKDAEILSFAWSAPLKQIVCVRSTKTYIPVLIKLF